MKRIKIKIERRNKKILGAFVLSVILYRNKYMYLHKNENLPFYHSHYSEVGSCVEIVICQILVEKVEIAFLLFSCSHR